MPKWLSKILPSRKAAAPAEGERDPRYMNLRRFESADTDRLNKDHWKGALIGQNINADLATQGETIRARCQHELANNPTLEGVVRTYADDVVGENGPGLQAISANEEYVAALETVCGEVLSDLDVAGDMALADVMRLWIRELFDSGEFISQLVQDPSVETPVTLRMKCLPARRMMTPPQMLAAADVTLGVRRTDLGRPTAYFIQQYQLMGVMEIWTGKYQEIPANDFIHCFAKIEAGQVRGVPWLSTCLPGQAELRDYDAEVLDACRQAANFAVTLYTEHPDADYVNLPGTAEIERGSYQTAPPGWKPMALVPPQPSTSYVDYRSERQRDAGRPVGMPLLMVRLDSSKHNYSSARFDAQVYRRGIKALRGWLKRRVLDRLVLLIAREAELYAAANPAWKWAKALRKRPDDLGLRWTWQGFPHVDDEKEANGQRMRMEDGTLSFSGACQENGDDPDGLLMQLAKDTTKLLGVGITPPWMRNDQGDPMPIQPSDELTAAAQAEGIDLPTVLQAQKTGKQKATNGAMSTATALTGSQLASAIDIVTKLAGGAISPEAATELLVAAGILRAAAEVIVKNTEVKEPTEPPATPVPPVPTVPWAATAKPGEAAAKPGEK